MKIKGESYYVQKRVDSFRYFAASLGMILAVYALFSSFYTLNGTNAVISVVEEVTDGYITLNNGIYYYDTPVNIIARTDDMPYVFRYMPVVNVYAEGGHEIITLPFYFSCCFAFSAVYFFIRYFKMIGYLKKDRQMLKNVMEFGIRLSGKYSETEKLKGIKNFRIKVSNINPITNEERYFYSTTLTYDPKLFVPDIDEVIIYVDSTDPEIYYVDFGDAIPKNEYIHYH